MRSCSVWLVVREPGNLPFFRLLAGRDEWFSDDLKKLDDENVYRKLQGHWIIEMSEMIATANAKSIEEIKSFLSRQKETYKVPYETHPGKTRAGKYWRRDDKPAGHYPGTRPGNRRSRRGGAGGGGGPPHTGGGGGGGGISNRCGRKP